MVPINPVAPGTVGGAPASKMLVIVPCGSRKIWDKEPGHGPALARDAYIGPMFQANSAYALCFADRWVILSAKYGLTAPDDVIPEAYNVTFKEPDTHPVSLDTIRAQITARGLDHHDHVIGLGGVAYRNIVACAFADFDCDVHFPFTGLSIGRYIQRVKRATGNDDPYGEKM